MNEEEKTIAKEMAEAHVSWYLNSIKPLLVDHMIHGFKHGLMYRDSGYKGENNSQVIVDPKAIKDLTRPDKKESGENKFKYEND